jgi:very-short-patch-repair endonuclease
MSTKRLTIEEFISRSKSIHENRYDYSGVIYKNGKTKVNISCPIHGMFQQRPYNHSIGEGCFKCAHDSNGLNKRSNTNDFIEKAGRVHGTVYDYSKIVYDGNKKKVEIICPNHGSFWQTPNNHLRGQTCPSCANVVIANKNRKTTDEFVQDAKQVHGDRYDYSSVDYKNKDANVIIVCRRHGQFNQSPHNHLLGAGCPKCVSSKGEQKIMMIMDSNGIQYERQKMFSDCRSPKGRMLRFDFFIPDKNVLIEYDGPQHFGDLRIGKYTLKKTEYEILKTHDKIKDDYTQSKGIKLVRISYREDKSIENVISQYL